MSDPAPPNWVSVLMIVVGILLLLPGMCGLLLLGVFGNEPKQVTIWDSVPEFLACAVVGVGLIWLAVRLRRRRAIPKSDSHQPP